MTTSDLSNQADLRRSADLKNHASSAASAGLAAAIAAFFGCIVPYIFTQDLPFSLMWGLWGAIVAFGGTYAGAFFITAAQQGKRRG